MSSLQFFQRSTLSRSKWQENRVYPTVLQSGALGVLFMCTCPLRGPTSPSRPAPSQLLPPKVPLFIPSFSALLIPSHTSHSSPPPSPPFHFPPNPCRPLPTSPHWDGCCTRNCSSARVTRRRLHLPWLLFLYSLSSDPTQGSKDGSGHPQIPNMIFSLLHMPWLWRKSTLSNLWWWVSLHLPFQSWNSNSWHGFVS